MNNVKTNRNYKARIFEMIFREKKALLDLYNAVNGTSYSDPEKLEINTLENAVYMSMKNDVSFVIDMRLNLYEHQSTFNPNMPLRDLFYVSDLYSGMTKNENLYGTRIVRVPTPKFIVFYNGIEDLPERQELKLSDAFTIEDEEIALELKVLMLNVNKGKNAELLDACQVLKDYSEYVYRVRKYAKTMMIEDAVDLAIQECIQEGILEEFFSQNLMEARKMSIYEYDEERHMCWVKEEGRAEGESQFVKLTQILLADKRMDDLEKALRDEEFRKKLYEELKWREDLLSF